MERVGLCVRRDPESFGNMVYHTKNVSGFIGEDGVFRYARYRLIPDPWDGRELGLADDWDREHAWLQNPHQDERRHRNYLKDATRRLLDGGGKLRYRLQIQLRDKPVDDSDAEWLSSAVPWDEGRFPYLDVAEVELDRALSYEESMLTWFHLGNHPESLPIPKARSIDGPHSLNHRALTISSGRWSPYRSGDCPARSPRAPPRSGRSPRTAAGFAAPHRGARPAGPPPRPGRVAPACSPGSSRIPAPRRHRWPPCGGFGPRSLRSRNWVSIG